MAKVVQEDLGAPGDISIKLEAESGNLVICGDSLRSDLLKGEFDGQLGNLENVFALAVDDCFDGFDNLYDASMRIDVLMGLLKKFQLDYAAKSSS